MDGQTPALTTSEREAWSVWKRAVDTVWEEVGRAITAATGLSVADFSVLSRLVEDAGGSCRQQELADRLGWQRPHASRQLSRMQDRGLLVRSTTNGRSTITVTDRGRSSLSLARPVHAEAVRRALLSRVGTGASFWNAVHALAEEEKG